MKKLKIGYFADGPWAHNALDTILKDDSLEIAFIVPRNDSKDNYLMDKALEYNIDYITPVNINSDDFYNKACNYNCDLFVSMSFNQIYKPRIFNLPPLKTINCHAGKLPMYRGRNILNWALINDESEFGITVIYVDEGIDTGDIVLQRTYPITDQDDYSTLLKTAHTECAIILYDAIKLIQNKSVVAIPQKSINPYGMYCCIRTLGDEAINWNQTSREIFNFVRAICKPGPMSITYSNKIPLKINKVNSCPDFPKYKGIAGQIIGFENSKPIVKTKDSYIIIDEYETNAKLRIGDRLGYE